MPIQVPVRLGYWSDSAEAVNGGKIRQESHLVFSRNQSAP